MKLHKILNWQSQYFKKEYLYQYAATYSGTLLIVCTGMHYGWPSPSLPVLQQKNSTIPVSESEGSWIASMQFIGVPFGCIITAVIVNRIGRKVSILIASPILFSMWIVVACATSAVDLMCARFIAGVADGIAHATFPMYVGEIADKNIRGLLGSSIQVSFMIGALLINVIGIYLSIMKTALIASVVPILHFITFYFAHESPYFYVLNGKSEEAATSLRKFNRKDNVDIELSELNSAIQRDLNDSATFLDVFRIKSNRKALGIMLLLIAVAQLSGYYAISFYCFIIFKEAAGAINADIATVIYFTVQVISAAVGCILVDRVGRKPLLLIAASGPAITLVIEGIYFYLKDNTDVDTSCVNFVPLVALFLYTITYSVGLTTIPVLLTGELFATSVKAYSVCISDIFFSVLLASVSKFFQIVKDSYGMHVPFFVFAVFSAIGMFVIIYFVPETNGKTLEQIQMELRELKPQRDNITA